MIAVRSIYIFLGTISIILGIIVWASAGENLWLSFAGGWLIGTGIGRYAESISVDY